MFLELVLMITNYISHYAHTIKAGNNSKSDACHCIGMIEEIRSPQGDCHKDE
jgi:hypothetical protein